MHPDGAALRLAQQAAAATAIDAVSMLYKITSFIALRDPELLAAAASAVGADALVSVFQGVPSLDNRQTTPPGAHYQPHQPHVMQPQRTIEDDGTFMMRQQEVELARLHQEAETSK